MPRTPNPDKLKARHALNCELLDITRSEILREINRLHPDAAQCLPLPDLEIPEIRSESYNAAAEAVFLNLFTPDGNSKALPWRNAQAGSCLHLDAEAVRAVYELLHKWYGLLATAGAFRDVEARRGRLNLDLGLVQHHLKTVASLPPGRAS